MIKSEKRLRFVNANIQVFTPKGGRVLDPYTGTITTTTVAIGCARTFPCLETENY